MSSYNKINLLTHIAMLDTHAPKNTGQLAAGSLTPLPTSHSAHPRV